MVNSEQRFQSIEIEIAASGDTVEIPSGNTLDTAFKIVKGVQITTSDAGDVSIKGSKMSLEIGVQRITDDKAPAGIFYGSYGVPQNKRFFEIPYKVEANGNSVKGKYVDFGGATEYPYTIAITFWLINE